MINVLVVDDQNLTHRLIETYLDLASDIQIIGFASDGQEAIEKISQLQPDIVLMDVEMPKMDGLTATKIVNQQFPQTKVLVLTVHDNEQHLRTALKNGARGYFLKTTTSHELINAIHYVEQGYFQLSVELTEKYLQKIIITKSEVTEISEIKRKVNYLYKSLNQLDRKLQQDVADDLEEGIEQQIEEMLQKEMALLNNRDSHLQFKVDRMKYTQERLEQNLKYMFKIQIACITVVFLIICYLIFTKLN
jgi:DNA-binding NarL/FixJ family response regulator